MRKRKAGLPKTKSAAGSLCLFAIFHSPSLSAAFSKKPADNTKQKKISQQEKNAAKKLSNLLQ